MQKYKLVQMDQTKVFAPSQAGTANDDKTTDYFDFVVSPPPHSTSADGTVDEDSFLHTTGYLGDTRLHSDPFIKETNNNTLTALPPVSTITGSLGHISHHNHHRNTRTHGCHLTGTDPVGMDTSGTDCDYWVTEDSKEQTCNILLEDLNKYCWTTQTTSPNDHHTGLLLQRRDSPLSDGLQLSHRDCTSDDRQNTDGAIYTLTVLNSEANSMDGLDCCKSPTPGSGSDSWTLRPNHLDLDAILNMESSVNIGGSSSGNENGTSSGERDHERQVVVTANGTAVETYATVTTSQYTTDDQTFGVTVKAEPGDNNNDWKLSDRNNLQDTVTVTESAAESLLRNALQGKLYPGAVTSTALTGVAAARILGDGQAGTQQNQDEPMHGCTEDLLLSQLDVDTAYRTGDYEKLKNIANEVVESYCNLEPVCNVSGTVGTVMYTLDPASGSLGTITLPADLAQVGTVTVVTTAPPQQDVLHQDTTQPQPQPTSNQRQSTSSNQLQLPGSTGSGRAPGTKAPKKYVRRANRNSANAAAGGSGAGAAGAGGASSTQTGTGTGGTAGSPGSVQQRKERSLHYCSICSKGFKDKYSVNVHIRTHTGEKPFACSLCGKSFRQKAHLAKHYQTHVTQKPNVAAAAAQATAAATTTATSSAGTSNNNSNGATSNASSNSGSARGAPSPTSTDLQAANARVTSVGVAQQQQQQQQQQQIPTEDSPIVATVCNPSS